MAQATRACLVYGQAVISSLSRGRGFLCFEWALITVLPRLFQLSATIGLGFCVQGILQSTFQLSKRTALFNLRAILSLLCLESNVFSFGKIGRSANAFSAAFPTSRMQLYCSELKSASGSTSQIDIIIYIATPLERTSCPHVQPQTDYVTSVSSLPSPPLAIGPSLSLRRSF